MYSDDHFQGGDAADEMERDFVEGLDEDGNTVVLEVIRYFFYNGEEYVVLGEVPPEDDEGEDPNDSNLSEGDEEEENTTALHIMKVLETEEDGEEMEEFVPVEDNDLLDKLFEIVIADFSTDEDIDG